MKTSHSGVFGVDMMISSNCYLSMIYSENRFPLFRIML
jgi:hypothetical protein